MWKFSGNASISMCIHFWSFFLGKIFEMETTPTHLDLTLGMSSILQSLLVFSVIGMVYLQSWVRIFCCCLHHALVIGQANTSSMYNKYIIAYIHIYIYMYYDMIILMMFRKNLCQKVPPYVSSFFLSRLSRTISGAISDLVVENFQIPSLWAAHFHLKLLL